MTTLTPAYNRDYKSATAATLDYLSGKDFILADISSQWDGKPCSCRDFPNQCVVLRYYKFRRTTTATYKTATATA